MAIVEGAFFKAGLYAAAAMIGYRHGADVPGLSPAIESFCTALGGILNRQARTRATRVASGLAELARTERIDLAPIEATLESLFVRHGLQAPELIDLGLDPERAAACVRARGEALFTGLDEGQPELVTKALKRAYAVIVEDTDFLETAQATTLRALLAQGDAIARLPPETANAVRAALGGNLLDSGQRILPQRPRESLLLRAEYGAVPFDPGRQQDLDDLVTWCCEGPAKGIRLITGAGGIGKTRLALELARKLRLDGWHAGFLLRDADAAPAFALDELFEIDRHLFVVVDYAETRRATVEDLARRLALHPDLHRRRILLLARSAGEWWDDLRTRDGDVRDLFERLGDAALEVQLGNLAASATERERSFAAAREAFAKRLNLNDVLPQGSLPDLTQRHFARALFLHIRALASLRGERPETEDELLDWVLRREEGTWRRALDAWNLPTAQFFDPFVQGAALVTLAGGAATSTDAWNLLRRVPALADQQSATLDVLTRILTNLYPGLGVEQRDAEVAEAPGNEEAPPIQIAGIRPDLLGEQLVDRQMGKLVDAAFGDCAPENLIKSALTVLNRLAGRRPASVLWLHAAFARNPGAVAVAALDVAGAASDPIGVELAKWITEHSRTDVAATLYPKLPYPTVALRELGLAVTELMVETLRASRERTPNLDAAALLAGALSDLGLWLGELGRLEEALAAEQEAVHLRRELAATRPDPFNPDLARSLTHLGIRLSELGLFEAALAAEREAARLWRQLAAARPDAFSPDLARSLSNLGKRWGDLGWREAALPVTKEAVSLWRELAAARPDAFNSDLALSLSNLGANLGVLGRHEAALAAVEEAVSLWRDLAAARPDAFNPGLAQSLSNLGRCLSELGRHEAASAAVEEAVRLRRELAAARPDAFNPVLGRSLNNLAIVWGNLDRREAALETAEEAVRLWKELAAARPDAFTAELARALGNQSNHQAALGRLQDAVSGDAAAISLLRPYFLQLPAAHAALMATLVRSYLERSASAGVDPDQAMLGAIIDLLRSLRDRPAGDPSDVVGEG